MADYSSYNVTILNRTKIREKEKNERKIKTKVITILHTHVILFPKEKAFRLYFKKNMN